MKYGLTETTVENICAVFTRFPEIEKAILYGSRAKGNFKAGSDIDLTLCGEAITSDLRSTIASALDELLFPYTIDLSVFNELNHAKLREHIERVGVLFYERANQGAAMKKGWKKKPFEECIGKVTYTPKVQRKDFLDDGAYPIISQEVDFINGYWDNEADLFKITTPIVVFGDHTKVLKYVDFDFVLGADGVKVLQPQDFLLPKFFFYQLQTANLDSLGYARHYKLLKELEIVYPAIPEQQRIVGILDEAFEGIATAKANAERNLQNARALFESHLQSVFTQRGEGWVETTVGQQIRFIDYRGKTPVKTESGIRLITAKNVKMGFLQATPMEFIASDSYEAWMTRGIPRMGDVLFTTEAPLANVAQLDTDEKVAFAQRIIIMQPDASKLDSTFLKYLLLSQPVQHRIQAKGTGATVKGIKASLLRTIEISLPKSIAKQREVVAKLDTLSEETQRLESLCQQKLAALEALKKSLLDQAFTGHL